MAEERTSIIEKIIEAYKQYAPKNITIDQFIEMVERDPVMMREIENGTFGAFSTYNPELARLYKELDTKNTESKDEFRNKLKESINETATEKRVSEIAKMYEKIILSDDEIFSFVLTFDILSTKQKLELTTRIVNAMNKMFGIDYSLDVIYTGKALNRMPKYTFTDNVYDFINNFVTKIWPKKSKYGRYGGYYSDYKKQIVVAYQGSFANFIDTLSHEYGHFIDHRYPEKGMLGAQIAKYSWSVYENNKGRERYRANPTEFSSFKIGAGVSEYLASVIKDNAKKRKDLSVPLLIRAIEKLQAETAGYRLKKTKLQDKYYELLFERRGKEYKNFYLRPEEEQEKIWQEIYQDPRLKDFLDIKEQYYDLLLKKRADRFPSFYSLSETEQEEVMRRINADPRLAGYDKIKSEYKQAINKAAKERNIDFYDLSYEEEQAVREELNALASVRPLYEKIQEMDSLREELREERFPSFYDLSEEERDFIEHEIHSEPDVVSLYTRYENLQDLAYKIRQEKYPGFYELPDAERDRLYKKAEKTLPVRMAKLKYDLVIDKEYEAKVYLLEKYEKLLSEIQNPEQTLEIQNGIDDR